MKHTGRSLYVFRYVKRTIPTTDIVEGTVRQCPTWAFQQLPDIPKVIDLKRPDRPSVLIPVKSFPLAPTPDTMANLLDVVENLPYANPRNTIGMLKWILQNAKPDSDLARRAQAHIDRVDQLLLEGKIIMTDEN